MCSGNRVVGEEILSVGNQAGGKINLFYLYFFIIFTFLGGQRENLTRTAGGRYAFSLLFLNENHYIYSLIMLLLLFVNDFGGNLFVLFCFLVFSFRYIFNGLLE